MTPKSVDIVVPVYNEEEGLRTFHQRLSDALSGLAANVTICYVNDGSKDATGSVLQEIAKSDSRVVIVELSRNFGHQAALTAGLDMVRAEVVVTLDGDGQHPPEMIPEMIRLFQAGYDVVVTQRIRTGREGFLKRVSSESFYRLLSRIADTTMVPGSADYRLMSRQVVEAVRGMREYSRFLRGMIAWAGYRTVILPYTEGPRLHGESKYSLKRMVKLAMDAIFSFSLVPLQIGIAVGVGFLILAGLELAYVLHFWLLRQQDRLVPGWSSLMFVILVTGGMLMIVTGFVGIYVGYIFQEVKRRPIYLVKTMHDRRQEASGERSGP